MLNKILIGHLTDIKKGLIPKDYKAIYMGRKRAGKSVMTSVDEFKGMFGNIVYEFEPYVPPAEHITILTEELNKSNLYLCCFCFKEPIEWTKDMKPYKCHCTKIAEKLLNNE